MSYWSVIPTIVRKSKRLTAEEKDMYYELADNLTEGGYCALTNFELAKKMRVSEKTVTTRLASLRQKKFANIVLNFHKHRRQVYLNIPGEPSAEEKPKQENLNKKQELFETSLKRCLVLGEVPFETLISKIKESSILDDVENNEIQLALNFDEIEFLSEIKALHKKIDCQLANYSEIDFPALTKAIWKSDFLKQSANLSLKWILEHQAKIIAGDYRNYGASSNFTRHNYSRGELNSHFQDIDEIII